ncbi:MAG: hypothetical protein HUJ71_06955 [Pseudobutyrivibrio sp.]|nr:hypothetical protein [Pseudobutyrivibrio sp.]
MSQSEDYLDSLLNAVTNKDNSNTKASGAVAEEVPLEQKESIRTSIEDSISQIKGVRGLFKGASGLRVQKEPLSEDDFIQDFESELESGDADAFIEAFEKEIDDEERLFEETGTISDSEAMVAALLDEDASASSITQAANEEIDRIDEENISDDNEADYIEDETEDGAEAETDNEESSDDNDFLDIDTLMNESEDIISEGEEGELDEISEIVESGDEQDLGLEDAEDIPYNPDGNVDDASKENEEFDPDANLDALADEFGVEVDDGDGEVDLSDNPDADLDGLMSSGEDEDLMDIKSLLNGDEENESNLEDIDESVEEESDDKKKKKKKEKKEKKDSPLKPVLQKIGLIVFGPPDEDDLQMIEISPEEKAAAKEAKKAEKQAKKEAKEAAKKEKEEAKKAAEKEKPAKPPKPPKPPKQKKKKEPDTSPKIPLGIIFVFLMLSASIIGVVLIGMNYMGVQRHMEQALDLYEDGNYILAYEKLNGLELVEEEDILTRNRARILADMQQCQDEYNVFIAQGIHEFALDSLIKGVGRYEKYKDEADEYGVSPQYESYIVYFDEQLSMTYGLSHDEALNIYRQKNRHYYTIEMRKVLRNLGLEEQ